MKKLKIHKGGVRCVEYSLDGGIIITGGKDKTIKVSIIVKGTWCRAKHGSCKQCLGSLTVGSDPRGILSIIIKIS